MSACVANTHPVHSWVMLGRHLRNEPESPLLPSQSWNQASAAAPQLKLQFKCLLFWISTVGLCAGLPPQAHVHTVIIIPIIRIRKFSSLGYHHKCMCLILSCLPRRSNTSDYYKCGTHSNWPASYGQQQCNYCAVYCPTHSRWYCEGQDTWKCDGSRQWSTKSSWYTGIIKRRNRTTTNANNCNN